MGRNVVSQKVHFSGFKLTYRSLSFVDQSSPDLFARTREELLSINSFPILDILSRSGNIRDQSVRLYKIHRNFACFWPPNIFRGAPLPEFLDLHYKIEPDSNGVAKFDGDRPRELGDLALKKKETSQAFYKSSRYCVRAA